MSTDPPIPSARVVAFPRGRGLYDTFVDAVARFKPNLAQEALDEIPQSGSGLPQPQALEEALRWIWAEVIPDFDAWQAQAYLRPVPGVPSGHSPGPIVREVLAQNPHPEWGPGSNEPA